MIVGIPKETFPGERRVAHIPSLVPKLTQAQHEVWVQAGAGASAGYPDEAYQKKGAHLVETREEIFENAHVILQVRGPGANPDAGHADIELLHSKQVVIGLLDPLGAPQAAQALAERGVTAFALELIPRIARAQNMDALSSQANIGGYKAVLLAAESLPRLFPMMMTAAGTITPARVLVVGAGVAGLQAIATARRLGAVVKAYDIRPEVEEQVHSLGAKFLKLELETEGSETAGGYAKEMDESFYRRQRELMTQAVAESDAVITTAAVPGKKAPILITEEMVEKMKPGSVVVDLAAERGGNCELTRPGEAQEVHGVTLIGPCNLPSTVPYHASQVYAQNGFNFLRHLLENGGLEANTEDQVIKETIVTRGGEVVHQRVRELLGYDAVGVAD